MVWQDYLLLLVVGGVSLFYYISRPRKPKRSARTRTSVQLSRREQAAWRKLQAQGYRLEEIHPEIPIALTMDRKQKEFAWEGNFSVSKGSRIYLVKVIRGEGPPSSADLRRELLLDYLVFQPRGIFLYDGEKEQLQQLDFVFNPGGKRTDHKMLLVRVSLILLIAIGLVIIYHLVF